MRETKMKKALAVVLAFAMVMAMSVMTFAAGTTTAEPSIEVTSNDGKTVVVTVNAKGDLAKFDFGLTYEDDKVTADSTKWDSDFSEAYGEVDGISAKNIQKDYSYIVFGGTSQDYTHDGAVATATFTIKEGTTGDLKFEVVTDSAALKKAIDALGNGPAPLTSAPGYKAAGSVTTDAAGTPEETEAPSDETEAPVATTEAPVATTEAPVATTEAPVATTEAPVQVTTQAPAAPTKTASPKTADTATVAIPMVAIVAAVAAVVVASKKKVED